MLHRVGDEPTTLASEFIKATGEEWVDLGIQPYLNKTSGQAWPANALEKLLRIIALLARIYY